VSESLRRTALYDTHVAAGARMVPFAGWEMPIQYAGVTEEHQAVRTRAGLFDVSHMGEVEIEGRGALAAVQRLITNDAARLAVGAGLYTPMCTPAGGIVDDIIVFRTAEQRYLCVVNAATRHKDIAWMQTHAGGAAVRDVSDATALLALQGPRAVTVLAAASGADLTALGRFHWRADVAIAGVSTAISRTGYTGEDGFEIACPWEAAPAVWAALMAAGRPTGLVPVGLAARDTLRLEAGLMLYGSDISEDTTPLEAPLAWTVKFDKGEFNGRAALLAQRADGPRRRLVGFEIAERAIARPHCRVQVGERDVGEVTSGTFSPTLGRSIGLVYVPAEHAAAGTELGVVVRDRLAPARVVRLPFYRGPRG
jgi:aminomethyltransferase